MGWNNIGGSDRQEGERCLAYNWHLTVTACGMMGFSMFFNHKKTFSVINFSVCSIDKPVQGYDRRELLRTKSMICSGMLVTRVLLYWVRLHKLVLIPLHSNTYTGLVVLSRCQLKEKFCRILSWVLNTGTLPNKVRIHASAQRDAMFCKHQTEHDIVLGRNSKSVHAFHCSSRLIEWYKEYFFPWWVSDVS